VDGAQAKTEGLRGGHRKEVKDERVVVSGGGERGARKEEGANGGGEMESVQAGGGTGVKKCEALGVLVKGTVGVKEGVCGGWTSSEGSSRFELSLPRGGG
jgi:hypothetical protein